MIELAIPANESDSAKTIGKGGWWTGVATEGQPRNRSAIAI